MITKGTIHRILPDKGFGFIRANGKDYFFHKEDFQGFFQDLVNDYNDNKSIEVEFEPEHPKKGPRARNVVRTDWPNSVDGVTI